MTPPLISQNSNEFSQLLELYKKRKPQRVLEIGTWEGGTLYHWLKEAQPGTKVGSIDIQRINEKSYKDWCAPEVEISWYTGRSDTQEAYDFAKTLFPIDWLFIDAGHSYEEVKYDFYKYHSLVLYSGITILHDILPHPGYMGQPIEVDKFWKELKIERFQTSEIIDDPNAQGTGIGIVW